MSTNEAAWWGVEHSCGGVVRVFPTLHWADEPEVGAGPRRSFECDACGDRYLFTSEDERSAGAGYGGLIAVAEAAKREGWPLHCATRSTCAEHIAEGDDKKDNWAFGQQAERSAGAAPLDATERAAQVAEDHAERLKHTSHRDGLGMGWQAGEELCREIAELIRSEGTDR